MEHPTCLKCKVSLSRLWATRDGTEYECPECYAQFEFDGDERLLRQTKRGEPYHYVNSNTILRLMGVIK